MVVGRTLEPSPALDVSDGDPGPESRGHSSPALLARRARAAPTPAHCSVVLGSLHTLCCSPGPESPFELGFMLDLYFGPRQSVLAEEDRCLCSDREAAILLTQDI